MNEATAYVVNPDGVDTAQLVQLPDGTWTNAEPFTLELGGFVQIGAVGTYTLRLQSSWEPPAEIHGL